MILNLYKISARLKVGNYRLPRVKAIHSRILRVVVRYLGVVGHDVYYGQVVANADFKVVGVMRRRYLHYSRSEIHIYIRVRNDRYLASYERQGNGFADILLISFVLWIYRYGGIA